MDEVKHSHGCAARSELVWRSRQSEVVAWWKKGEGETPHCEQQQQRQQRRRQEQRRRTDLRGRTEEPWQTTVTLLHTMTLQHVTRRCSPEAELLALLFVRQHPLHTSAAAASIFTLHRGYIKHKALLAALLSSVFLCPASSKREAFA